MKIGDLVKHKYGTLYGAGLILKWAGSFHPRAFILWNCHGHVTIQNISTKHLEVISESR